MENTPRSVRLHIAIFGRRNVGKSSLINTLTQQQAAVVSDIPGTTTDPVYKSMELIPVGPVVFIDTPGIDDEGELGRLRIEKSKDVLRKTDLGLLVIESGTTLESKENSIISEFEKRSIPYIIVFNKCDINNTKVIESPVKNPNVPIIKVSAVTGEGIEELILEIARLHKVEEQKLHLIDGLVKPGDLAILVTPIDKAAPKGRLILPQQQVLRDILDNGALALVVRDKELASVISRLSVLPDVVITDSQAFGYVAEVIPGTIPLTSFSIIFARQKGSLKLFIDAVAKIDSLEDGDLILVAEGCTHHRKEDDIGTVKIPNLLRKKTGKNLNFEHTAGDFFKSDLSRYKMVIHCGACMLNKKEMEYRQEFSMQNGVPVINYGIILAYLHGILDRAINPFRDEL